MPSKVFDRWLTSSTDMPTPGSATRSRCASSSTGSGSTAGPAEKLKTRWVVVAIGLSKRDQLQIEHTNVAYLHHYLRPSDPHALIPSDQMRQQSVAELRFEPG